MHLEMQSKKKKMQLGYVFVPFTSYLARYYHIEVLASNTIQ